MRNILEESCLPHGNQETKSITGAARDKIHSIRTQQCYLLSPTASYFPIAQSSVFSSVGDSINVVSAPVVQSQAGD